MRGEGGGGGGGVLGLVCSISAGLTAELARAHVELQQLGLHLSRVDALGEHSLRLVDELKPRAHVVHRELPHARKVLLLEGDRVQQRRGRHHERVDDVALGDVLRIGTEEAVSVQLAAHPNRYR